MNELDLSRGLRQLSDAPRIDTVIAEADVARRVRRGRAVRASGIAAVCVAAVLGVGTAVWAIGPFDAPPLPPARTSEPAPTPDETTPQPDPEPTSDAEPEEADGPDATTEPDVPPIVAVDAAGNLVLLDPTTGAVTRTVVEGVGHVEAWHGLRVDRRTGTASFRMIDAESMRYVRVELADGDIETLSESAGLTTSSPDGRTSLERGHDDAAFDRGEPYVGYTFRDTTSGDERWVVDPNACECDQAVSTAWSPDSTEVAILTLGADGRFGVRDLAVLPQGADAWDDARILVPAAPSTESRWFWWSTVTYLGTGELAVVEYEDRMEWFGETGLPAEVSGTAHLVVLDPVTGAELRRTPLPDLGAVVWTLAPAPDGDGLVGTTTTFGEGSQPSTALYRIREDGTTDQIASGYQAIGW